MLEDLENVKIEHTQQVLPWQTSHFLGGGKVVPLSPAAILHRLVALVATTGGALARAARTRDTFGMDLVPL